MKDTWVVFFYLGWITQEELIKSHPLNAGAGRSSVFNERRLVDNYSLAAHSIYVHPWWVKTLKKSPLEDYNDSQESSSSSSSSSPPPRRKLIRSARIILASGADEGCDKKGGGRRIAVIIVWIIFIKDLPNFSSSLVTSIIITPISPPLLCLYKPAVIDSHLYRILPSVYPLH